jgi:hypothetical protein
MPIFINDGGQWALTNKDFCGAAVLTGRIDIFSAEEIIAIRQACDLRRRVYAAFSFSPRTQSREVSEANSGQ